MKTVFADPKRMGVALDSMVGGGSIISGGRVNRSVLGYDVRTNSYPAVAGPEPAADRFRVLGQHRPITASN